LAIDGFEFAQTDTHFATGVRIMDRDDNKSQIMRQLGVEFPDASNSMKDRVADIFDRTWDQLFGGGMRPAKKSMSSSTHGCG
jgi:hypothetical protein